MAEKTAIIPSIRQQFNIPIEGFKNETEALGWYRQHYHEAKGGPFHGSLGYRFDRTRGCLFPDYEYDHVTGRFSIATVPLIDKKVPFDQCILSLALRNGMDAYSAPALRLVVLVGKAQDWLPYIPRYVFAPLGAFRLLAQSPGMLSSEERKELLDNVISARHNITIGYLERRKHQKMMLYMQVFWACEDWIYEKRKREQEGKKVPKKGYLQWIAKRLVENYGWKSQPSSYTVKRYLDRAIKFYHMPLVDKDGKT